MVGRLPALKYLEAASSKACHTSSAGCRHETSACVCTSIAIRSFVIILSPLVRLMTRLVPVAERTPLGHQALEQRRRLPMQGTELIPVFQQAVVNGLQTDRVHRTAVPRDSAESHSRRTR